MAHFTVNPLKIDISQTEIDHFKQLLQLSKLPDNPIIPGADEDSSYGISLPRLKSTRDQLINFDWPSTEADINQWHHYTVHIEKTQIHFIHEKSTHANAIPLLLLHGWPFSFWEFKDAIAPLINPPPGKQAFHVVVPSLPGVFLSSVIPDINHTTVDVARIFNTLMVDVLGYTTYGAQGGDFGAINLRQIQLHHSQTCILTHFNGFPAAQPESFSDGDFAQLPEYEIKQLDQLKEYYAKRSGYMAEQTTEVSTIGYALYDGLGMTSWVAGKYAGLIKAGKVPEEDFDRTWKDAITNILLYQYTHSAHTSMVMYKQSGLKYILDAFKKNTDSKGSPMGASLFSGEFFFAPRSWIEDAGDLVWYKYHPEGGGHIPALTQTNLFVDDLREFFSAHWSKAGSKL